MGLINTIYICVSVGYTLANTSTVLMFASYIMLSTGYIVTKSGFNICKYGFNKIFDNQNKKMITYKKIEFISEEVEEEYILEI